MNIGGKIALLRKEKNWSQGDLAQKIEASREIIGKYERNENLPSIEMVAKTAKAFGVTVDYVIGEGENASFNKETVERLKIFKKWMKELKVYCSTSLIPTSRILKPKKTFAK